MNYQHRCQKRQKWSGNLWAISGLCTVAFTTISVNVSAVANTTLDARIQEAMVAAIQDEYQARAFYSAAIEKFGNVRPFSNIVQAEERHAQMWKSLFAKYDLPIPEDTFAGKVEVPDTLNAACQMGVEAEIANVKMYDNFLSFIDIPDLKATFIQLRNVSQNNHLRAFERCSNGATGRGMGRQGLSRGNM